jgi:hypothetical protein
MMDSVRQLSTYYLRAEGDWQRRPAFPNTDDGHFAQRVLSVLRAWGHIAEPLDPAGHPLTLNVILSDATLDRVRHAAERAREGHARATAVSHG